MGSEVVANHQQGAGNRRGGGTPPRQKPRNVIGSKKPAGSGEAKNGTEHTGDAGGILENFNRPILILALSVLGSNLIFFMLVLHFAFGSSVFDVASAWDALLYIGPSYLVPAATIGVALFTRSRIVIIAVALLVCAVQSAWIVNYVSAIADPISRSYGWVRLWQPLAGLLSAVSILPLYRFLKLGTRLRKREL